jgi:hypothetical protein
MNHFVASQRVYKKEKEKSLDKKKIPGVFRYTGAE